MSISPKSSVVLLLVGLVALPSAPAVAGDEEEFTAEFAEENCTWVNTGRGNPLWPLHPGDYNVLKGWDADEGAFLRLRIKVTDHTQEISYHSSSGVPVSLEARVIEEREWVGGEIVEVSRNFMAMCLETRDVFYFGEDVDDYEDGVIVGHEGAWRAGVDGAVPGIIMPGSFLLGSRYFQEIAPGVALDLATNDEMGLGFTGGGETFGDCVLIVEGSALDPDSDSEKVYCPGAWVVVDDDIELVRRQLAP